MTSTASTSAQTWFDRGLVWSYAFHHEEAIRCFERSLEHDPGFALAHWGIAYALGPNYNKQWEAFDPVDLAASLEKACHEVAAGRACTDRAAPVERALVAALESRCPANDPSADLVGWNADYAEAMREVYRTHPDDLDIAALFADALMNLTPWALWDRYAGLPSEGAATLEAKGVLERALDRPGGRTHPGSCTSTCTSWRCRRSPSGRYRSRISCAPSSPTPATSCTCRRTSMCCAGTTRARSSRTCARSRSTRNTSRARVRWGSTRSTTPTTATSRSTRRCSSAFRRSG